ncbi:hypothetical protein E4665_14855 [Sporolactobacillus shoreae]|uniref:DUF4064 domain-containing protein n=1 Tax=Sporolactobacillus shoreae TaxID=1465501 RepID=A0A4Z0GID3_9BACL|nr:hypothetical protein [Sporolactobacillus shoreae]TGA96573.1 hypothetical protein E4665_14855 [Sporolactobacillus shoreae]
MKKTLGINHLAGSLDIINALLALIFYPVILIVGFGTDDPYTEFQSGLVVLGTLLFYLIFFGAGLVIHIIGLVKSKKAGVSITGHILGILGTGCFLIAGLILAIPDVILLILAAIFTFIQKNVNHYPETSTLDQ